MNRIRDLREDKDLNQRQLAKILNISQQQYSRYETGLSEMTYDQLKTLANFYHTSIDYILCLTDERKPYTLSVLCEEKSSKKTKQFIKA